MCGLGSLYTVTQLVDFFEGGPGGVHTNARAWELHVAGPVPVLENSKVQIYFFQLMKLFDELSLHLRGVCTEQSTRRCYWKVGCATWPLVPALLGFIFRTLEMGSFFHYFTEISTLISQESHEVEFFGTRKGWEVCCHQEFEYLLKCPNLLISPTRGLRETQCNQAWGLLIPSSFLCWIKIGSANVQS